MAILLIRYGANFKIFGKTDPKKLSYAGAFTPEQGTPLDLPNYVSNGHLWMPALLDDNGKRWQNLANHAEVLGANIDQGLTLEQAIAPNRFHITLAESEYYRVLPVQFTELEARSLLSKLENASFDRAMAMLLEYVATEFQSTDSETQPHIRGPSPPTNNT